MITAVDSSVLFDVFLDDPRFGQAGLDGLEDAAQAGAIVVCDVVVAEVAGAFQDTLSVRRALDELGVTMSPLTESSAIAAGMAWGEYRRRGGPRTQIVADFLVGAHALHQADALLTRDRGFVQRYFPKLQLIVPGDSR